MLRKEKKYTRVHAHIGCDVCVLICCIGPYKTFLWAKVSGAIASDGEFCSKIQRIVSNYILLSI